ncbi:MAG: Ig-like domain-containing protein [bacterium]
MRPTSFVNRLFYAFLALVVVNCSDNGLPKPADPVVVSVSITPPTATLHIGETQQLTAIGTTDQGTSVLTGFTYSTSAPAVATVTGGGLVSALTVGTATVTAKLGSIEKSSTITVTPGFPATITKVAGDNQSAAVQTAVAVPPSVQVKDAGGNVIPGALVTFSVFSGGGSVAGGAVTADAQGIATAAAWTLGAAPGLNTLTATVNSVASTVITTTFTGIATPRVPGPPAAIVISAGDAQSGTVGLALPIAPAVQVREANGLPLANIVVSFAVATGGGSIVNATATTNASGIASAGTWTLGAALGAQTVTATVTGLPAVTFTATAAAVPTPPALLAVTRAAASATIGVPFGVQPIVEIRDAAGLIVPTATNVVTLGISAGSITGTISVAAVAGVATFTDLTPLTAGAFTLTYFSPGLTSATSPIMVATRTATQMTVITQPVGATSGNVLATQPVLQLQNVNNVLDPAATNPVTVTLVGAGGTLAGTTVVNGVGGTVTFTNLKVTGAGTYTLKFSTPGFADVSSAAFTVAP